VITIYHSVNFPCRLVHLLAINYCVFATITLKSVKPKQHPMNGRVQTVEWTTGMEYWTGLLEWLKLIARYM